VIVERGVLVPERLAGEVAEAIVWHLRSGRPASPELHRLCADLGLVDTSFRRQEAVVAGDLVGWVPLVDAARQAGVSARGMRARASAHTVEARKVNGRWQVRTPLSVIR
jgi:hypothetical protein